MCNAVVAAGIFGTGPFIHAADPAPVVPANAPANAKKPFGIFTPKPAAAPPRLLPAAEEVVIQPVSQTDGLAAASAAKKSEVMRQLEMLYEKDGRDMPEMNTDIKPVPNAPTGPGAATPAAAPTAAAALTAPVAAQPNGLRTQQPAMGQRGAAYSPPAATAQAMPAAPAAPPAAKSKYPVVAFFKKMIPGNNKDPKPSAAGPQYRPDVAPVPPGMVSQPPTQLRQEPNRVPAMNVSASSTLPLLDSQPRTPFATASNTVSDPLPKPLAELADVPPTPNSATKPAGQVSQLPPLLADAEALAIPPAGQAPATTETTSPFTEMSEADADKKGELNPFTGLTLDDDAGSASPAKIASTEPGGIEAAATPAGSPAAEDPFADELEKMGIVPPGSEAKAPAAKLLPPADSPTFEGIEDQATRDKMKKIHERGSMKGLKGFCPVTLRDQRELVDAKPDFHSTFRGQKFHFADAEAKLLFDEDSTRYAPAAYGADVVALTRDKDVVEGSLDFAAWFKGRLYLFGTQETHDTFVANPATYATPAGIE